MPVLEAYVVTAFCLDKLVGRELLESELIKEVLEEMKRRLSDGSVVYGECFVFIGEYFAMINVAEESVAVDPVKNALKLFQTWDILECHAEKKLRLYYLKESQDDSDCVSTLYSRLNKYKANVEK